MPRMLWYIPSTPFALERNPCGVSRITSYPQAKEYHKGLRSKEKDWKVCHSLALMIGSHTNIVQDLCARKNSEPVTKLLPGDWAEEAKLS